MWARITNRKAAPEKERERERERERKGNQRHKSIYTREGEAGAVGRSVGLLRQTDDYKTDDAHGRSTKRTTTKDIRSFLPCLPLSLCPLLSRFFWSVRDGRWERCYDSSPESGSRVLFSAFCHSASLCCILVSDPGKMWNRKT